MCFTIHGIGVSGGIAIGRAHLLTHTRLEVEHYDIAPTEIESEMARFDSAIATARNELAGPGSAHPGERAARVRGFPQPASDDPGRQHAV